MRSRQYVSVAALCVVTGCGLIQDGGHRSTYSVELVSKSLKDGATVTENGKPINVSKGVYERIVTPELCERDPEINAMVTASGATCAAITPQYTLVNENWAYVKDMRVYTPTVYFDISAGDHNLLITFPGGGSKTLEMRLTHGGIRWSWFLEDWFLTAGIGFFVDLFTGSLREWQQTGSGQVFLDGPPIN